ncbi:hypothetical protein BEWA_054270 [Theileria equi strain WA]|uniref:Uncharacterized protein n=1 Tax=Theileria equi strain WA TaxID=1537102 RepID=L1LDE8_THEEQ|nr:hypothetical protein BEWA_054270 [Theileria equi strain WA]EKX73371.1 hypothetical protein BEWA_054270 [Theileria equi strain WA]|eukprot:XP_004832823.1 hypothetical protein BEWA_054270 [Theileria equi strain WA]
MDDQSLPLEVSQENDFGPLVPKLENEDVGQEQPIVSAKGYTEDDPLDKVESTSDPNEHASAHTDVVSKDTKSEGENNDSMDQNDDPFSATSTPALDFTTSEEP